MDPSFYESYYHHENHHWWFRWRFELVTKLIRNLALGPAPRILDAGCGTGQMLKRLELVGEAVGIDTSAQAIAFAASRGARRLVRGSITALPFPADTFDCVVALDVIEHVDDDLGILQSLHDVVKPEGSLIVTVPAFQSLWSEHDVINQHKRRYTAPALRKLMEQAGFEVDRITYCNTTLFLPIFLMRKLKNLTHARSGPRSDGQHALESDLKEYPGPINEALFRLMEAELRVMRYVDLPFGVSILAVAHRAEAQVLSSRSASQRSAMNGSAPATNGRIEQPDPVAVGTETVRAIRPD